MSPKTLKTDQIFGAFLQTCISEVSLFSSSLTITLPSLSDPSPVLVFKAPYLSHLTLVTVYVTFSHLNFPPLSFVPTVLDVEDVLS